MIARSFLALLVALVLTLVRFSPAYPDDIPTFQLGFKVLADLIPERVGEPLEDEHHNPFNGDGLQITTGGLLVWRKADNWTAFTNGWRTWVNGPLGLQERGNEERFAWEINPEGFTLVEASAPEPADADRTLAPTTSAPAVGTATLEASPTWSVTEIPDPTVTPEPPPTATSEAIATATRTAAPAATTAPSVVPSATLPAGGVLSPDPAGEWVTSTHPTTQYYTSRDNEARWQAWAPDNRIWFNSEAALLAGYPGRIRDDPLPTSTPRAAATSTPTVVPSATPTRTAVPAATPTRTAVPSATSTQTVAPAPTPTGTAKPTATTAAGGIRSPDPAGDWVTSTYPTTQYYTTRDRTSIWMAWSEGNRIWFQTEAALLAAYPGRIFKEK